MSTFKAITLPRLRTSETVPALQDEAGRNFTAPFTTFDEERAMEYARFAAEKSNQEGCIVWPERKSPMDI